MTGINMFFLRDRIHVKSKAILDCWIGIIRSAVLSGKLSILDNLLHLVHLFYTSNLKVWFAL
jgi:hypothetical protein